VGNAVFRFLLDCQCFDCVAYKRPGRKINLLSFPLETPLAITFSSDQIRLANREREPPEYPCVSCYSTFTFLGQFLSLHRVCPIPIMSVKNWCISSIVTWAGVPLVSWDAIHRRKEWLLSYNIIWSIRAMNINVSYLPPVCLGTYVPVRHWKQQHLMRNTSKKAARAMREHVSSLHSEDSCVSFASSGLPIEDVNNLEILAAADMIAQYHYQLWLGGPTVGLLGFCDARNTQHSCMQCVRCVKVGRGGLLTVL
jgi:hypothetical protein